MCAGFDRRESKADVSTHPRLHQPQTSRRQDRPRNQTLPQEIHRPPNPPRTNQRHGLTHIEESPTSSASSKPDLDHPPRWRSRAEQHDEWVRSAPLHATGTLRQKQTPSTQPRPRPQLRGGPLNTSPGRIESTKSTLNEQQTRTSPHGTSARTGTTWDQRSEQRRST